jgi:hypothetical protein
LISNDAPDVSATFHLPANSFGAEGEQAAMAGEAAARMTVVRFRDLVHGIPLVCGHKAQ